MINKLTVLFCSAIPIALLISLLIKISDYVRQDVISFELGNEISLTAIMVVVGLWGLGFVAGISLNDR